MNRTLQQLKESVERLIEQQGAEASCAAYIFTKEDVFVMNDDGEEVYFDEEITNKVLNDLDETDYILEQAFDCITDYIGDCIGEIKK
jgi:transcriptional/translational regulatory protein YebC/TACO1